MTTKTDWVNHSLELCAELDQDITNNVYDLFFAACPEALELMGHSDEHMRGRMMAQVLELLIEDAEYEDGDYLSWEIENHIQAYAVKDFMYLAFLPAVKTATQQALGQRWQSEHDAAWDARLGKMQSAIERYSAAN